MSRHYEGSVVIVEATIRDRITGELADPTTVTFDAQAPDDTQTELDVDRISQGIYQAILHLTDSDWWDIIVTTTGSYDITEPARVYAIPLPFTP